MASLRRSVAIVAILNLAYFLVEFASAQLFNSLSLLSDSLDFLEDASINLLIFVAFAWSNKARKVLSYLLAGILLIPGALFIFSAVSRIDEPLTPNGKGMTLIGIGALIVNSLCVFILIKHRYDEGGLAKAAFLSARNDAVANLLIISAGVVTLFWQSQIPDLLIGIAIFLMNLDAALQVIKSQRIDK